MSSPEHTTILDCASKLETALRSDRDITHYLFKEGFISETVYDDVLDPRSMPSAADKAGMLVAGIRKKVKDNFEHYNKLMRYFLENKDKYADIIKILDAAYSNARRTSSESVPLEIDSLTPEDLSDREPTFSNILSFLKEEGFSSADSETLGGYLEIPRPTINTLKKDNQGNSDGLLYDVIGKWMQGTEPSWEELAKALDKSEYKKMARKIQGSIHTSKPRRNDTESASITKPGSIDTRCDTRCSSITKPGSAPITKSGSAPITKSGSAPITKSESKDDTVNASITKPESASVIRRRSNDTGSAPVVKPGIFSRMIQGLLSRREELLTLCASDKPNVEGLKEYLDTKDVDINVRDNTHKMWTSLMWACKHGNKGIVEILLEKDADIHLKDEDGWNALHLACSKNRYNIATLLLERGANPDEIMSTKNNLTPIHWISDLNYIDVAQSLLKFKANLNITSAKNEWTPLICASSHGQKGLVELYLEYKADPNYQAEKGWTALMAAAKNDRDEIIRLLIEKDAKLDLVMKNAKKQTGESALHVACYMNRLNAVKVLVEKGADANVVNQCGLTALMLAITRNNLKVARVLLEESKTIDVNIKQKDSGITALILAAKKGQIEMFESMLKRGAKIESMNILDLVSVLKRRYFKEILKRYMDAEPSARGQTPVPEDIVASTSLPLATGGAKVRQESDTSSLYDVDSECQQRQSHQIPPTFTTIATEGKTMEIKSERTPSVDLSRMGIKERMLLFDQIISAYNQGLLHSNSLSDSSSFDEESNAKGVQSIVTLDPPPKSVESIQSRLEEKSI